jgi:hypothetical protein
VAAQCLCLNRFKFVVNRKGTSINVVLLYFAAEIKFQKFLPKLECQLMCTMVYYGTCAHHPKPWEIFMRSTMKELIFYHNKKIDCTVFFTFFYTIFRKRRAKFLSQKNTDF